MKTRKVHLRNNLKLSRSKKIHMTLIKI